MHAKHALIVQIVQPFLQEWFPRLQQVPHIQPLAADASSRRYFRMHWPRPVDDLPASCVLMVCDPWQIDETPDFLAVRQHLQACDIRVPRVYGVAPLQGLMCLEDFGDRTLATLWRHASAPERLRWGKRAIDELVKLHTIATRQYDALCPAFHLAFDVPKLLSELQFFRQHAIEGLWQRTLPDTEREALDEAFIGLCTLLASQPRYFCHRDYHGWNIMVHGDTVGILDFQDARLGPQPYDLASLLVDRGTPEVLGQKSMHALIEYYVQRLEIEEGRAIDRHEFHELFDYVSVQRCLKAVGTFAYMDVVHHRQQYRPYIPHTLAYVQPLLQRYDTLRPLAEQLRRYIPLGSS